MRKEQISKSQAYILIIAFMIGTTSALSSYSESKQDTWIALLMTLVLVTPVVIIYGSILNNHPGKDLFQILEHIFGKITGKIIGALYTFYFFHLGAICIRNMTEFIQVSSFPETPQYLTALFIGSLTIYILKSGLEVMARTNRFITPFLIFILIITLLFVIPRANPTNFLPILENGWLPVIKHSFLILTFPFGETILFMSFFNTIEEKKKASKVYLKGVYLGGLTLFSVIIRNILILGFPGLSSSTFPSFDAVSLINIGDFVRGIEVIIAIVITMAGFMKVAVCSFASCIGIARLFGFDDYKWVSAPLILLMISLSFILYDSTMRMVEWVNVYQYYVIPFQLIFPVLILIFGKFKKSQA